MAINELSGTLASEAQVTGSLSSLGIRGYSAYQVAVNNGYTGTEEEWLASLVGNGIDRVEETASSADQGVNKVYLYMTNGDVYAFDVHNGSKGSTGFSPTIMKTDVEDGVKLTINNETGTTSCTIYNGGTFTPYFVGTTLYWRNDRGLENPSPVNLKGDDGMSAYEEAVAGGYTGTEAEFQVLLANAAVYSQQAKDAATSAATSATAASTSATNASNSATSAAESKTLVDGVAANVNTMKTAVESDKAEVEEMHDDVLDKIYVEDYTVLAEYEHYVVSHNITLTGKPLALRSLVHKHGRYAYSTVTVQIRKYSTIVYKKENIYLADDDQWHEYDLDDCPSLIGEYIIDFLPISARDTFSVKHLYLIEKNDPIYFADYLDTVEQNVEGIQDSLRDFVLQSGVTSNYNVPEINDDETSTTDTWSSQKISDEIEAASGDAEVSEHSGNIITTLSDGIYATNYYNLMRNAECKYMYSAAYYPKIEGQENNTTIDGGLDAVEGRGSILIKKTSSETSPSICFGSNVLNPSTGDPHNMYSFEVGKKYTFEFYVTGKISSSETNSVILHIRRFTNNTWVDDSYTMLNKGMLKAGSEQQYALAEYEVPSGTTAMLISICYGSQTSEVSYLKLRHMRIYESDTCITPYAYGEAKEYQDPNKLDSTDPSATGKFTVNYSGTLQNVGLNSAMIGDNTVAGAHSAAIGLQNSIGSSFAYTYVVGTSNTVDAAYTVVTGNNNTITNSGAYSYTEGTQNSNGADHSHVEGWKNTVAMGASASHIEGYSNTVASGCAYAHVEGQENMCSQGGNIGVHVEGKSNTLLGGATYSHVEGTSNTVNSGSQFVHVEGNTNAVGSANTYVHVEGSSNTTNPNTNNSHIEGQNNTVSTSSVAVHAEGSSNTISGTANHVEGGYYDEDSPWGNTVDGYSNHAEGTGNNVSGKSNHAEGYTNTIGGYYSHAEGYTNTMTNASASHVEGSENTISGFGCHAEGYKTSAAGNQAHAEGWGTIASSAQQHVQGLFNVEDDNTKYLDIVGCGSENNRANASALDWYGNLRLKGNLYIGCNADSTGGVCVTSSQLTSLLGLLNIPNAEDSTF